MRPLRPVTLLFASLLLVAQSCAQSPTPTRRDVVIGLVGEPAAVLADDPNARIVAAAVTEQLVRRDARGDFVPRLATRVPTVENGGLQVVTDDPAAPDGRLVATFVLRRDLIWQDGAPLTAPDVRFAWETDRTAPLGSDARWQAERVELVEVLDEVTVRFVYNANEHWDSYPLAAHVLPLHRLAGATAAQRAQYDREPVHAGPFAVAAWLPGIGITLSAFKGYALGPPALGRLEIHFYLDRSALLDALRRGDVDVVPAPGLEADLAATLDRFADGARLQTFYKQSESIEVLRYGPRFADPVLRQAIELAIDRRKVSASLFEGRAIVPRTFIVPPGWAAADVGAIPPLDRRRANALLAAAGYRHGTFGILERGPDRYAVAILVADGSIARAQAASLVAGDLATIGIAADVRVLPAEAVRASVASGAFDLAVQAEDVSDPQHATDRYRDVAGPWFKTLALAATTGADRSEKRLLYGELARSWSEGRVALPLYQRLQVDVAPRGLTGVDPTADGAALTWNAHDWRFVTAP